MHAWFSKLKKRFFYEIFKFTVNLKMTERKLDKENERKKESKQDSSVVSVYAWRAGGPQFESQ